MTDQADGRLLPLARLVAASDTGIADAGPECLDEIALAELVDGASRATRASAISHLASCRRCRQQLATLMELLADPAIAAEVRRMELMHAGRGVPSADPMAVGFAAVAALVLFSSSYRTVRVHRCRSIADQRSPRPSAPLPLSPQGDVSSPSPLTWRAVPDADRYRVRLFGCVCQRVVRCADHR